MRRVLLILSCFCSVYANGQKTNSLEGQLRSLIKGFNGDIGIYVKDLKTGASVSVNGDTVFPTASIVKVPILIGIMDKISNGEMKFHQQMLYTDSLYYSEGDDVLSAFKDSSTIELGKVITLMLSFSDNCASLWLQGLSGGGERINKILDSLGYRDTRVNSRTPGRRPIWEVYGWGQTTPREAVSLMERIVKGEMINKEASEKMLRLLGRQYWDEEALSQIPPDVFVASKSGAVDESRNELLFVNSKENPYIFSIFTKNNKDTSWERSNEAWVLTRKVSALLWKHFNPRSTWMPSDLSIR